MCVGVLKKYEPRMYVGIRSETYPLFRKISYLSAGTVYPGIQISLETTPVQAHRSFRLLTLISLYCIFTVSSKPKNFPCNLWMERV